MATYVRDDPDEVEPIDRWDGGIGWLAHPEETARRASHAVRAKRAPERQVATAGGGEPAVADGGEVWVIDPLDGPGVDELLTELGDAAGVAVLSSWHARDAGTIARRHGVSVHLPEWMGRVADRVDAPVERYVDELGDSGFRVRRSTPLPTWHEAVAYRPSDGTLIVPESLGTAAPYLVGDERLGLELLRRLSPPRSLLGDVEPERVLVSHGRGVFSDADAALSDALDNGRRRFPHALVAHGPATVRSLVGAVRA